MTSYTADLRGADLRYANLIDANRKLANLPDVFLMGIVNYRNNRSEEELRKLNLLDAELKTLKLMDADLRERKKSLENVLDSDTSNILDEEE